MLLLLGPRPAKEWREMHNKRIHAYAYAYCAATCSWPVRMYRPHVPSSPGDTVEPYAPQAGWPISGSFCLFANGHAGGRDLCFCACPHRPTSWASCDTTGEHALSISERSAVALRDFPCSSVFFARCMREAGRRYHLSSHAEPRAVWLLVCCPLFLCSSLSPARSFRRTAPADRLPWRHMHLSSSTLRRDDYPLEEQCSGLHIHTHTGTCSEYLYFLSPHARQEEEGDVRVSSVSAAKRCPDCGREWFRWEIGQTALRCFLRCHQPHRRVALATLQMRKLARPLACSFVVLLRYTMPTRRDWLTVSFETAPSPFVAAARLLDC
jgi:hypothetical protein